MSSCTNSLSNSLFALSFWSFFPKRPGTGRMEKVPCMSDVAYIYKYIFNSLPPMDDTSRGRSITTHSSSVFFFFFVKTLWRKKKKKLRYVETVSSAERERGLPCINNSSPLTFVSLVNNPAYIYIRRCCSRIDYIRPIIHIPPFFFLS